MEDASVIRQVVDHIRELISLQYGMREVFKVCNEILQSIPPNKTQKTRAEPDLAVQLSQLVMTLDNIAEHVIALESHDPTTIGIYFKGSHQLPTFANILVTSLKDSRSLTNFIFSPRLKKTRALSESRNIPIAPLFYMPIFYCYCWSRFWQDMIDSVAPDDQNHELFTNCLRMLEAINLIEVEKTVVSLYGQKIKKIKDNSAFKLSESHLVWHADVIYPEEPPKKKNGQLFLLDDSVIVYRQKDPFQALLRNTWITVSPLHPKSSHTLVIATSDGSAAVSIPDKINYEILMTAWAALKPDIRARATNFKELVLIQRAN